MHIIVTRPSPQVLLHIGTNWDCGSNSNWVRHPFFLTVLYFSLLLVAGSALLATVYLYAVHHCITIRWIPPNLPKSDGSEIMLRASSGAADPLMLTITDGRGSYQGKIAAGPAGGGLILYRMQKPCATITADAPWLVTWCRLVGLLGFFRTVCRRVGRILYLFWRGGGVYQTVWACFYGLKHDECVPHFQQFWWSKNVSNLSMQVYPLLESVKDNMVASTIRKGDTLRIQAKGKTETRLPKMCQIRHRNFYTKDFWMRKLPKEFVSLYALCCMPGGVLKAQMFRVLFLQELTLSTNLWIW